MDRVIGRRFDDDQIDAAIIRPADRWWQSLVDNSIWQKTNQSNGIAAHREAFKSQRLVMNCPPQVLEYCPLLKTPMSMQNSMTTWTICYPRRHTQLRTERAIFTKHS